MSTTGADGLEICWNAEHGYAAGCECDLVGISRPATTKEWRFRAEQAERERDEALARAEEANRLLDVLADHVVIEGFACLDDDIHEIACELDLDDIGLEKMYRPALRELIRRFAVEVGTPAEPKGDTR